MLAVFCLSRGVNATLDLYSRRHATIDCSRVSGECRVNQDENDETCVVQSPAVCNCRLVAGHLSGGVGVAVESSRG
jgi:hypothetical protein